jgi:hypothetical protein
MAMKMSGRVKALTLGMSGFALFLLAVSMVSFALSLSACADGTGPMGEPAHGLQGVKNAEKAEAQSKAAGDAPPRGGGSPLAPTGPEGAPTAGPTDAIGPH